MIAHVENEYKLLDLSNKLKIILFSSGWVRIMIPGVVGCLLLILFPFLIPPNSCKGPDLGSNPSCLVKGCLYAFSNDHSQKSTVTFEFQLNSSLGQKIVTFECFNFQRPEFAVMGFLAYTFLILCIIGIP